MDLKDINYLDYGKDTKGTIVLLHGWGQNIEMMNMLGDPFKEEYRIIVMDLPGFGKTKEPDISYGVKDYATWVHELLEQLKVKNPIIVGHSLGGRIAICYASIYDTKKVVLLSAPFRPSQKKGISFKTRIYKLVKKIKFLNPIASYLKNKWGSADYKNASEINRGSLVKIVNEDLTNYAKTIKCPVLMIYGTKDEAVDYNEAKVLETLIKDAGLVTYEGATHYAYLERLKQTLAILKSFFE